MLLAHKDGSRHRMSIDSDHRTECNTYRGDHVHDGIELFQSLEERRNPIDEINRIGAADCGCRALNGRTDDAHFRDGFLYGFSGCIYGRDIWGVELVG